MRKFNQILLFLNFFLLQSYLVRFSIFDYPSNLQEILIATLAISFLALKIKEKSLLKFIKNQSKNRLIWSLIILTFIGIITTKTPLNIDLLRYLKFLFFGSILATIFLQSPKQTQEKAIKIAGFGALAFGIFSLFYNLAGLNVAHDLRLLGPLDAAVYLGYYLTPFFLFFAINAINKPSKNNLTIATLLLALIIATRSMGAIAASFLITTLYIVIKEKKRIFNNKKLLAALITIGTIISVAISYNKILPTLQTQYSSLDERGEIWITSIELLKNPKNFLLGVGPAQFEAQYIANVDQVLGRTPLDYYVIQPHNIFLLFQFHYGILGLALIIFLIFKTLKKLPSKNIWSFIFLYFLLHGLIDTPIFKNDLLILFLVFGELALSKTRNQIQ